MIAVSLYLLSTASFFAIRIAISGGITVEITSDHIMSMLESVEGLMNDLKGDKSVLEALRTGNNLSGFEISEFNKQVKEVLADKAAAQPEWSHEMVPVQLPSCGQQECAWVLKDVAKANNFRILSQS